MQKEKVTNSPTALPHRQSSACFSVQPAADGCPHAPAHRRRSSARPARRRRSSAHAPARRRRSSARVSQHTAGGVQQVSQPAAGGAPRAPQLAAGGELSTCLSTPHCRRELSRCLSPPQASSARLSPPQASSKRPSPLQAALRIHSPPQAELRTPRPVPDRAPRASAAPLAPRDGHLPQLRRRIMVCTRRRRCSIWWPVTHTVIRSSAGPQPAKIV